MLDPKGCWCRKDSSGWRCAAPEPGAQGGVVERDVQLSKCKEHHNGVGEGSEHNAHTCTHMPTHHTPTSHPPDDVDGVGVPVITQRLCALS